MDAKKTGAFIAQLRKEKNYTQKELAERLHVSDKAVSRWETGKGFPETTLLGALSEQLNVSVGELLSGQRMEQQQAVQQADRVIVESLHRADQTVARANWMIILAVTLLVLTVAGLGILLSAGRGISALQFLNSDVPMHYHLGVDNVNPQILYHDFSRRDFDGGYEYYTPDGTMRYVFTEIPEFSDAPVMSYMHCSTPGTKLFGVEIGGSTMIEANPVLGIEKDYSLMEYLQEQGFTWQYSEFQYGRRSTVYLDGERCNWMLYRKDNVFINLLISAREGRRLLGFDVGFTDPNLESILQQQVHGCRLRLEDPEGLVKLELEEVYLPGTPVTLYARKPGSKGEMLYLYVNGHFLCEFEVGDDPLWPLKAQFTMLAQETTVKVTTEKPDI